MLLSLFLTPYASGTAYRGIIITNYGWDTGLDSAFLAIRVYRVETECPNFTLPRYGVPYPPIRYPPARGWWNNWTDYLFYINGSGAYLVETITPDSPSPVLSTFPQYVYEGSLRFSWYLIIDHNTTPLQLSPRHALGIYRFNGSCLKAVAVENSTEFPWELQGTKYAVIEDYGSYMLFDPEAKGSLGWTPFNVSKELLNKYFGPNTTRHSVSGMVFMNRSAILIVSHEGFFEGNGGYYLLKPVKFYAAGYNFTAVETYSNWSEMPYYGVLIYPRGFVPLLRYDPTKLGQVILTPNVKPFRLPFCRSKEENSSGTTVTLESPLPQTLTRTQGALEAPETSKIPLDGQVLLGGIAGVGIGLVIGMILRHGRGCHEKRD
ncbi:hypothetical protein [Thermococcus sp.]